MNNEIINSKDDVLSELGVNSSLDLLQDSIFNSFIKLLPRIAENALNSIIVEISKDNEASRTFTNNMSLMTQKIIDDCTTTDSKIIDSLNQSKTIIGKIAEKDNLSAEDLLKLVGCIMKIDDKIIEQDKNSKQFKQNLQQQVQEIEKKSKKSNNIRNVGITVGVLLLSAGLYWMQNKNRNKNIKKLINQPKY